MAKKPVDTSIGEKAIEDFVKEVLGVKAPIFMGIDGGGTGGLALICGAHYVAVPFPVRTEIREGKLTKKGEKRTRTLPDLWGLLFLFSHLRPVKERVRIAIEQAQVQIGGGGDNAYTAYRVAQFYCIFPLFLLGRDYKYIPVRPAVWKAALGVTSPRKAKGERKTKREKKGPSVDLANQLFPDAKLTLEMDGQADALLLAEFARRAKFDWENIIYGNL